MYPYNDVPSPRERYGARHGRGPPVAERFRPPEEDQFEFRPREDRYGPPARRPEPRYEDDELVYTDNPRIRVESPLRPPRPQLIRRQSSLDTFDLMASRRRNDRYHRDSPRISVPSPPRRRSPSPRSYESDFYEDIRIADPDSYGDEEYRDFRDRERRASRRHRSRSGPRYHEDVYDEVIEKPYPRRGRTRVPRRLVDTRALIEIGYPFQDDTEDDKITILWALSRDQIDNVVSLSRKFKRRSETRITYHHMSPSPSPPRRRLIALESSSPEESSEDTLTVTPVSSRRRSSSRYHSTKTVRRPRSVSVHPHGRRYSSPPPRVVELRGRDNAEEPDNTNTGPVVLFARPRDDYTSDNVKKYHEIGPERRGGVDISTNRQIITDDGDEEEIIESRNDRRVPHPRLVRAMMATLT